MDSTNIFNLFLDLGHFIIQMYEAVVNFLNYSFTIPGVGEVTILALATVALPVFLVLILIDKVPVV